MAKTDPLTEIAAFRAPRWAWSTIDQLMRVGRESADLDLRTEIENAKDVMEMLPDDAEYTLAHMENAMLLMGYLTERIIDSSKNLDPQTDIAWLAAIGGTAEMRGYVASAAKELEKQFTAIGLKWDEDADWYDLTERIATAITIHPTTAPAQLVRDVLNAELRIVFRPPVE